MPDDINLEAQERYAKAYNIAKILCKLIASAKKGTGSFTYHDGDLLRVDNVFTLDQIKMSILQELILRDLTQNPEVYCFKALVYDSGARWNACEAQPAPEEGTTKMPSYDEMKQCKILSLPCLELATPGSLTTNSKAFGSNLKGLFMAYKHRNLPLPEKIIFNCGSMRGIHVVTMVFDFKTEKCQALDDFGERSTYDHIYNGAMTAMNNALRDAGWEQSFDEAERTITESFHTSMGQNPFGPGAGTCYASSLLLAVIAAKYPDDVKQGICNVLSAHLGKPYSKADLDRNLENALAKFSWSWLASVVYHLAKKHPEELYRIGGTSQSDEQAESKEEILERTRQFIEGNMPPLLGKNDECMKLLRGAPVRESKSAAAENKTAGGTGKAKSSPGNVIYAVGWDSESKDAPLECKYPHHENTKTLVSTFSNAAPDSKAKSFFDANVSFIRKIPIIRAICNWILFGWPFGNLFWKHSFEAKLSNKLDTLIHQKCYQLMSALEGIIFGEKDAWKLKKYKEIRLADNAMLSKEDEAVEDEVVMRREVAVNLTDDFKKYVAPNDRTFTIENLLEKVAQTPEEDKNLSLDKFLERLGLHLDQTIERACRKQLEAEKQKNQGTELSSDTPSTKFTKEGESSKISPESTTSSVQAR